MQKAEGFWTTATKAVSQVKTRGEINQVNSIKGGLPEHSNIDVADSEKPSEGFIYSSIMVFEFGLFSSIWKFHIDTCALAGPSDSGSSSSSFPLGQSSSSSFGTVSKSIDLLA